MLYSSPVLTSHKLRAMQAELIVSEYGPACRAAFDTNADVPVLIPAHNEAADLPATLAKLAQSCGVSVAPVVIANNCDDQTADFADDMGARVIEEPTPGKMVAVQTGLRVLAGEGQRTILLTDADTLHHRMWAAHMSLLARSAAITGGIVLGSGLFRDGGRTDMDVVRTLWVNGRNVARLLFGKDMIASGYNLGVQLDTSGNILDKLLELPNYFPGEDAAMRDTIKNAGGAVINTMHPQTTANTRGDRYNQDLLIYAAKGVRRALGVGPVQIADYGEYDTSTYVPYTVKN